MATGFKSGGRVRGVSKNKPKPASVTTSVAAAGEPGARRGPGRPRISLPDSRAGDAHEAIGGAFPRYRVARVDSLSPYANNPRTHTPAQLDLIVKLITEYGWTNPILVDGKRGVIAGHGRLLAAQKLGMDTVPTIELSHLSASQRRAYVIADNASALKAGWDDELLAMELGELRDDGFDLSLTGFDAGELAGIFGDAAGLTDPDDAPPVPENPITVVGDVWLMGGKVTCPHCQKTQAAKRA